MEWTKGKCEVCGRESKYLSGISEEDSRLVCCKCGALELGYSEEDYEANLAIGKTFGILPIDVDTA